MLFNNRLAWLVPLFVTVTTCLSAQPIGRTWFLGGGNSQPRTGIRFAQNPPAVDPFNNVRFPLQLNENNIMITEPTTGGIVFYSDGQRVVDATHTVVPGGNDLAGSRSAMYGTAVVRDPTACNSYLLFSVEDETVAPPRRAHYSRVNTQLPGNGSVAAPFGDVDPTLKNVQLLFGADDAAEGVYAVPKAEESLESWVFIALRSQNQLKVFDVAAAGVTEHATYPLTDFFPTQLPVDERIFGFRMLYREDGDNAGRMVLSVARKEDNSAGPIGYHTFDRTTGTFAAGPATVISTEAEWTYGLAFSPNGTKLYYSDYFQKRLYQYDFSAGQLNLIDTYFEDVRSGGLQNGPDGKIYWANVFVHRTGGPDRRVTHLAAINNPDGAGASCDLEYNAVTLPSENRPRLVGALPIFGSFPRQLAVEQLTLAGCSTPATAVATAGAGIAPFTYSWDNGETADTAFSLSPGEHFVTITSATGCTSAGRVTIESADDPPAAVEVSSEIFTACGQTIGGTISLTSPGLVEGNVYVFSFQDPDGSATALELIATGNNLITPVLPLGDYDDLRLTALDGCPLAVPEDYTLEGTGPDTGLPAPVIIPQGLLCPDSSVTLIATSLPGVTYEWSLPDGSTVTSDRVTVDDLPASAEAGYTVVARLDDCRSDTSLYTLRTPPAFSFPTIDTVTCTGQLIISLSQPEAFLFWEDGALTAERELAESGTYTYLALAPTGCPARGAVAFESAPEFIIDLPDSLEASFCTFVTLDPQLPADRVFALEWVLGGVSSSDNNLHFQAIQDTLVSLVVNDLEYGCRLEKSVRVDVPALRDLYAPNAFSPNGDGVNDGFTLYHKSETTSIVLLEIYDRWGGQAVRLENIPVNRPDLGWDGMVNDTPSGISVFVYRAVVRFQDGTETVLTGDVMLVR